MNMYLTGFAIDCLAILALSGYSAYNYFFKKPITGLKYIKPVLFLIITECFVSAYFAHSGNLTLASVIVWVQAVAVIVTALFILLIIIFKPDWR
ncbi:hypothetical protein [Dyadobacter aurulentus]|uniref:hypothetical protein n=1 Tax=Dyadobacter sp. UC 10 TaxID=2605428 RepID=UPI0011F0AAD5|nr:hypothetical protein [Dyadobacter sp. UC 10]KAA0993805.1 hypothetical protein FXO21_28300 [Dyadobacter sp. UC 10]